MVFKSLWRVWGCGVCGQAAAAAMLCCMLEQGCCRMQNEMLALCTWDHAINKPIYLATVSPLRRFRFCGRLCRLVMVIALCLC